jgi:xanthine dehydrogenase YagT iron-sulfur-binding subunit
MFQTQLAVNEECRELLVEARTSVLDVLRNDLGLTGAKKVCDMGDCGACTVLLDGEAMYACLLLAVDCHGQSITTIEHFGDNGGLHPVQEAFIACDALQCGFCTPGQILSLVALFEENATPTETEIRKAVAGNLCRCAAYPSIVEAALSVASSKHEPADE